MTSSEWQDIGSAPKDGTVVRARRVFEGDVVFEGDAIWRAVTFESFINGPHGVEPEHVVLAGCTPTSTSRFRCGRTGVPPPEIRP